MEEFNGVDLSKLTEEQRKMLFNSVNQEKLNEQPDRDAVINQGKKDSIAKLLSSKMMKVMIICCIIGMVFLAINAILGIVAAGINIGAIVGVIIGTIIGALILNFFLSGSKNLYNFNANKDLYKLQKGVNSIKSGLTFYQVVMVILIVLIAIIIVAAIVVFSAASRGLAGAIADTEGIALVGVIALAIVGIAFAVGVGIAIYILKSCKRIVSDVYNKMVDNQSKTPKILPSAIVLLVIGGVMLIGEIVNLASGGLGNLLKGILPEGFGSIFGKGPDTAIAVVAMVFSFIGSLATIVPFVLGGVLMLKYKKLLQDLESPLYQGQII